MAILGYSPKKVCGERYEDKKSGILYLCRDKPGVICGQDLTVVCEQIDEEGHIKAIGSREQLPVKCRSELIARN